MTMLITWLKRGVARKDIMLAAMLLIAVFMMIVPLPTELVDVLIAINLALSITLLMMSVYILEPMEFSAFPAVLLITTLYRLALTISTSRLILLNHDAGKIVYTFGSFAVGGNLAVGMVVFAIITIVQFIVITKGSERVAEVGARFSLDGMPGKQMSIDGDLRAGTIDAGEARRLRAQVQKESQLYGAMDGAMKFVKGDAIASIIIILVNIVGGICIGVFMHGMDAGEAASTYAILSVGDGLIAQIPALLISIAAGIIVTRVPGEIRRNLASELFEQIVRHQQALWIVAAVLLLFACLPGFPVIIFSTLAFVIAGGCWWLTRQQKAANTLSGSGAAGDGPTATPHSGMGAVPLLLRLNHEAGNGGEIGQALSQIRAEKLLHLGLPLPEIKIEVHPSLAPGTLQFMFYQESVLELQLSQRLLLDISSPPLNVTSATDSQQFSGATLQWVDPAQIHSIEAMGLRYYSGKDEIAYLISLAIDRYAAELIGVQETRYLMDQMESNYGELVKELQRQMPVNRVAEVLQRLISEGVSIRDLRTIFEALVEWAPREKDPLMLTEYARIALRRHIVGRQLKGRSLLKIWIIGANIEQMVRESVRKTSAGAYSILDDETNLLILNQIKMALSSSGTSGVVLVSAIDIRRFIRKLTEHEFFYLAVLSGQEIENVNACEVLGHVDIGERTNEAA